MKLTRAQEKFLIQIGLEALIAQGLNGLKLDGLKMADNPARTRNRSVKKKSQPGMRWTPEHREKFYATLERKRRAESEAQNS